eukprot:TRINITY_DN5942_c0_g1_i1.p1 TRINITY_DN5942_c0_g1~~TRINITY_DN5942_c0_g1_i1.p1  ORF type:complete len:231 (-),score=39.32 TRINITY_DN5942_c0_g1_i1:200-892(-)
MRPLHRATREPVRMKNQHPIKVLIRNLGLKQNLDLIRAANSLPVNFPILELFSERSLNTSMLMEKMQGIEDRLDRIEEQLGTMEQTSSTASESKVSDEAKQLASAVENQWHTTKYLEEYLTRDEFVKLLAPAMNWPQESINVKSNFYKKQLAKTWSNFRSEKANLIRQKMFDLYARLDKNLYPSTGMVMMCIVNSLRFKAKEQDAIGEGQEDHSCRQKDFSRARCQRHQI